MESTKDSFLSWAEISSLVDNKEDLNPIDQFIYDNEPAGEIAKKFREQLFLAICYENEETKTERNSSIVSSFIEHCKNEGFIIPDSYFESYFGA